MTKKRHYFQLPIFQCFSVCSDYLFFSLCLPILWVFCVYSLKCALNRIRWQRMRILAEEKQLFFNKFATIYIDVGTKYN
jgi:hypothetical protein